MTTTESIRSNANIAIDSFILGDRYKNFKHVFIKDDVCPHCDLQNKTICSPVLPAIINADTDSLIRGKNEHEAGHARFTPVDFSTISRSRVMCNLINALEDERIERGISAMSSLFRKDLDFLNKTCISDLNRKFANGDNLPASPFMEAIFAMHFEANGHSHLWNLSEKAQSLYDAAKDIYKENRETKALEDDGLNDIEFKTLVSIAERIVDVWKQMDDKNQPSDGSSDDSEEDDENPSEGCGDGDSEGSSEKDAKDGNGADDNGNSRNGKQKSSNGDSNDDSENGSGDSSGKGNSRSRKKSSKNGSSVEKDKASEKDGESGVDGSKTGGEKGDEGWRSELSENWQGDGTSDFEGIMKDEVRSTLEKRIRMDGDETENYTSYTGNDKIVTPAESKSLYSLAKRGCAGAIGKLSSAVEQSLRSLSRCRVIGNRERGDLDRTALPAIAKSLTKNIFSKTTKGISLDVAVTILVDESGSTSGEINEYRKLAVAFSEVLDRLGIDFEVLGHTTSSKDEERPVEYTRSVGMVLFEHKAFGVPYHSVRERVANMHSHNCNLDGDALLCAFKRNKARRTARHVILVISDGMPSGTNNLRAEYAFLKNIVKVCRKNGIEVYGFGVGTEEPKQFYGEDNFVYLESDGEMHGAFFKKFSEIITRGNLQK